jgi:hypothetical protein
VASQINTPSHALEVGLVDYKGGSDSDSKSIGNSSFSCYFRKEKLHVYLLFRPPEKQARGVDGKETIVKEDTKPALIHNILVTKPKAEV